MKTKLPLILIAVLLSGVNAARAAETEGAAGAVKIMQDANGKTVLTLAAETQKRIGLAVTNPAAAEWQPEIRATGRALDTAPLADLMADYSRALIAFDSAHQELERAKQLKKDGNISDRAFQEAEVAYRQDFTAVMAVRLKVEMGWGKRIAAMPGDIVVSPGTARKGDETIKDVLDKPGCLIRVDLPAGERLSKPGTARIVPLAKRERPITANYFDKLPVMDALTQQQSLLFVCEQPAAGERLVPGEAVTAFVKSDEPPISGVLIPAEAVLRQEGRGFVFVQTAENTFARRPVALDHPLAGGYFSADFSTTDRVVVTGAQTLLSAELSGGGFNTGQRD